MKKIYALILLATNIISTTCMEQQRPKRRSSCDETLLPIPSPSSIIPVYINTIQPTSPRYAPTCAAEQPSWQQLNSIANTPYQRHTTVVTNEVELKPIYRNTNHQNTSETDVKKTLSHTLISEQSTADLMEKLYNEAVSILNYRAESKHLDEIIKDQKLPIFISSMRDAKNNNITEDIMGKYAYDKSHFFVGSYAKKIALIFSCLKKYFLAQEKIISSVNISYSELAKYPAYMALADSCITISASSELCLNPCADFLYTKEEYCSSITYANLTYDFYTKASDLFLNVITAAETYKIYDLLQILNKAKKSKDIHDEDELGYDVLSLQPEKSIVNDLLTLYNEKYSVTRKRNCASLFCASIKKYNQTRNNKITPTPQQIICYCFNKSVKRPLYFALPDNFNNRPLDEKQYALDELYQLMQDIDEIRDFDDQTIEQQIRILYPPKK